MSLNTAGIALAMMGVAALVVAAPGTAMADHAAGDDMPHMVITVVCGVYSDYLDGAVSTLSEALDLSIGGGMPECTMSAEYHEGAEPTIVGDPTAISMPDGSGYPDCADADICFVPSNTAIKSGESVTWTNNDRVQHTITENSEEPLFDVWVTPGSSFTFTFDTAGTYDYRCKVHPWATGTVTVTDAAEPTGEDLAVERIFEYADLYKENGVAAFDMITQGAKGAEPDAIVIGYVLDAAEYNLVAHDSNPAFVGFSASALLAKAFIPIEDLGNLLMEEEGNAVPLSYPRPDVQGNIIGYTSGQFTYYDGYVFGATFIPTDEELVRGVVDEMIRMYDRDPDGAFDTISSFESTAESYPFVLDVGTQKRVAHGANPDVVGTTSVVFTNSSIPLATFQTWEDGDSGWAAYTVVKPGETEVSSKISWLVMHDGYLFGAGYYP